MTELTFAMLSAVLTIFGALIIFLFKDALENLFILPKRNFRKSLVKTKANLLFYEKILISAHNRNKINDIYYEKIIQCMDALRKNWVQMSITYPLVAKVPFISKEPGKNQIKIVKEGLLFLSNSAIVYFEENKPIDISKDCLERQEEIKKILSIIDGCL